MTEGYDPRNNGIAERVNGILKEEFLKHMDVRRDNIRQVLEDVINTYHTRSIFRQLILHFAPNLISLIISILQILVRISHLLTF